MNITNILLHESLVLNHNRLLNYTKKIKKDYQELIQSHQELTATLINFRKVDQLLSKP